MFDNLFMGSCLVSTFVVLAIVGYLLSFVYSIWRHSQKAGKIGCGETPLYPSKYPFGISTLFKTIDATREKGPPQLAEWQIDFLSRRHNRHVPTFRMCQAGRRICSLQTQEYPVYVGDSVQ